MNEKLRACIELAPLLKSVTGVDAAIGIWDDEGVVQEYIKAKSMDLYFPPGYKFENTDVALYRVLRTGKREIEKLPKEVLGTDIECTVTPIFDGRRVVGAITYAFASEVKDRINENMIKLSSYVENTNQSINEVSEGAEVLKSKMNSVQAVAENVITKLQDALGVVEEIKQNAKLSNILALNASIESARAGEAGKGFAVVADEMRKFSRMSAEASEKINCTLGEITKSLDGAKEDIEKSAFIAHNQAASLVELEIAFKDVSETATQISVDSKTHNTME